MSSPTKPFVKKAYHLCVMVLAAGASKRIKDKNKLLMPIDDQPMLIKTLSNLRKNLPRKIHTYVVTGFESDKLKPLLAKTASLSSPITTLVTHDHAQGLYTSVSCGIRQIMNRSMHHPYTHVLIHLGDCPLINPNTVRSLVSLSKENPRHIIRPRYQQQPGHPVFFPCQALEHLPENTSSIDRGLKPLFKNSLYPLKFLDTQDSGILTDIDDFKTWQAVTDKKLL
jgi:molybdenum cofactor cytidylyltransferase